jgi:hypothetical protein
MARNPWSLALDKFQQNLARAYPRGEHADSAEEPSDPTARAGSPDANLTYGFAS